jgi:hypothetical protein
MNSVCQWFNNRKINKLQGELVFPLSTFTYFIYFYCPECGKTADKGSRKTGRECESKGTRGRATSRSVEETGRSVSGGIGQI